MALSFVIAWRKLRRRIPTKLNYCILRGAFRFRIMNAIRLEYEIGRACPRVNNERHCTLPTIVLRMVMLAVHTFASQKRTPPTMHPAHWSTSVAYRFKCSPRRRQCPFGHNVIIIFVLRINLRPRNIHIPNKPRGFSSDTPKCHKPFHSMFILPAITRNVICRCGVIVPKAEVFCAFLTENVALVTPEMLRIIHCVSTQKLVGPNCVFCEWNAYQDFPV